MKNTNNGVTLTVESKFNSGKLNPLQRDAKPNVQTQGGLITDNPTNKEAGRVANALINVSTGGVGSQVNKQ